MAAISVIVPVYKVEAYLHRCVDSILAQSFSDFEVILVDDGSPDNCGAICEEYAARDSRAHVLHQENSGLSAARNTGIDWVFANSDSQWLTFVDSDDWIHEDYLRILYDAVIKHDCLLSTCGIYKTEGKQFPGKMMGNSVSMSADNFYCGEISDMIPVVACGKLYHKKLFANLRYPVGKLHEDEFTTYLAVYDAGRVAVVSDKLYVYFQNQSGITLSKWSPRRLVALEAIEEQIKFARKNDNLRLLNRATDSYVWTIALQAEQLASQCRENPEHKPYLDMLCKKMRSILKEGMNNCVYPLNRENLLLYETAYPVKPLWDLIHTMYAVVKKVLRRR